MKKIFETAFIEAKKYDLNNMPIAKIRLEVLVEMFDKGVQFANEWIPIKQTYAEEISPLGKVLIKDIHGYIEIAKLVRIPNGTKKCMAWKWEIENKNTLIDLKNITLFRPIERFK